MCIIRIILYLLYEVFKNSPYQPPLAAQAYLLYCTAICILHNMYTVIMQNVSTVVYIKY